MERRVLFGRLLSEGILSVAARRSESIAKVEREIADSFGYSIHTVQRWRRGYVPASSEQIQHLVKYCAREGRVDRKWGDSILYHAGYLHPEALVSEIWGTEQQAGLTVHQNLPSGPFEKFVGRKEELKRLLELFSPNHSVHLISVAGIGGVGKTSLVLEAGHKCLRASRGELPGSGIPTFEAIVFTSAKNQYLTSQGIMKRLETQSTLHDIFREISSTLDRPEIIRAAPDEQLRLTRQALSRQRTLLIVDNLETMQDPDEVLAFLYDLPSQVKVVITTRQQALFSPIRLLELSAEDSLDLIRNEAVIKGLEIGDEVARAIYERISGVPAALVYTIGQIAARYTVKTVLERVANPHGDVARFCFGESVELLQERRAGPAAYHLLIAISIFLDGPIPDAAAHVAGLAEDYHSADLEDAVADLLRLSLVTQRNGRYTMLPLTREYAQAELANQPNFEQEARQRWVEWYLKFAKQNRGYNWREWHPNHAYLEQEWVNLLAVFNWCKRTERYEDLKAFWLNDGMIGFTRTYGMWSDRITWFGQLIDMAEQRGDWQSLVLAMVEKGWTLAVMGARQLEEAGSLLQRAWSLREHVDLVFQSRLAWVQGVFHIYNRHYPEALDWLEQAELLLQGSPLKGDDYIREWLHIPYHQGETYFRMEKYKEAEKLFRQVLQHAEALGWNLPANFVRNWLADIALLDGKLDEAERLLRMGLPVAERNKEKRRAASYKRSFAYLERQRGNRDEAYRWAEDALLDFEKLGMERDADEMRDLLASLTEGPAQLSPAV